MSWWALVLLVGFCDNQCEKPMSVLTIRDHFKTEAECLKAKPLPQNHDSTTKILVNRGFKKTPVWQKVKFTGVACIEEKPK